MNRGNGYVEAKDRVKIGHFTEMGMDFNGVVHIGTNDGYEIEWYRKLGLKVVGFEPLESAYKKCAERYAGDGEVYLVNAGIALESGVGILHETVSNRGMDDSGGSSFLKEIVESEHTHIRDVECKLLNYSDFMATVPEFKPEEYDCLVVDVQGMEMDVLASIFNSGTMRNFKAMNIECSLDPVYENEVAAHGVIYMLQEWGFKAITPVEVHNDILFVRED